MIIGYHMSPICNIKLVHCNPPIGMVEDASNNYDDSTLGNLSREYNRIL
jgi:hypothetical protein